MCEKGGHVSSDGTRTTTSSLSFMLRLTLFPPEVDFRAKD